MPYCAEEITKKWVLEHYEKWEFLKKECSDKNSKGFIIETKNDINL